MFDETTTRCNAWTIAGRRCRSTLVAASSTVLLSACGTDLFKADFEADIVGSRPSMSPAGPPTGDMIRVWIAEPDNLVVIADGINSQSLLYSYQPSLSQVDFIGIETGRDATEFWAAWNGRAEQFSAATPSLNFSVGNFNAGVASLEIAAGEFVAAGERLGAVLPGETHTVVMHVDAAAGTYTVSIFQPRGGNLASSARMLRSRGLIPGDRVFDIAMFYDVVPSLNDPASYVIDDILITEEEPETP